MQPASMNGLRERSSDSLRPYGALIERCPEIEFVIYEPSDCPVGTGLHCRPVLASRLRPFQAMDGRKDSSVLAFWRSAFAQDNLDLFETFHLPFVRAPNCPTVLTMHDIRDGLPSAALLKRNST